MKKATELDMNRTVEELLESELGFILLEADVKNVTFKPSIAPTVSRGERRTDGTEVSRQLGNRTLQRDGNCRE